MPSIIKDGSVVDDPWVAADSPTEVQRMVAAGTPVYISLELLLELADALPPEATLGVVLEPGQEPGQIREYLAQIGRAHV